MPLCIIPASGWREDGEIFISEIDGKYRVDLQITTRDETRRSPHSIHSRLLVMTSSTSNSKGKVANGNAAAEAYELPWLVNYPRFS